MTSKLKQYFPMIHSREEVIYEIESRSNLKAVYDGWEEEQQTLFLDFCTGVRGVKILYDFMFKEILNPETVPERIEDMLSVLLGTEVKVLSVLPNDSTRIADETSLLITDIVVELADGSLANVEVQKIGYSFPGERSACYSSDLLLRQYKRIRSKKKKLFSYKDIKNVYTIIFFEQSPREFHAFPEAYIHFFEQKSDTGLKLNLLQKYFFIPLDIFIKSKHNKDIETKAEAWLAFLGADEPEMIISLMKQYPEFKELYAHVYDICRNIERVMGMFSKELQELDRNTVQYMIDEMQEEIKEKDRSLKEKDRSLKEKDKWLEEKDRSLEEKDRWLEEKNRSIEEKDRQLEEKDESIEERDRWLEEKDRQLEENGRQLKENGDKIEKQGRLIEELEKRLRELEKLNRRKE